MGQKQTCAMQLAISAEGQADSVASSALARRGQNKLPDEPDAIG